MNILDFAKQKQREAEAYIAGLPPDERESHKGDTVAIALAEKRHVIDHDPLRASKRIEELCPGSFVFLVCL
jgi:hypothetical protein